MLPERADPSLFEQPLQWWLRECERGHGVPLRTAFRPEEFSPSILPHLVLNDVFDGGARVRVRLVGGANRSLDSENRKGQWLFDFLPNDEVREFHSRIYRGLVMKKRPVWVEHEVSSTHTLFSTRRLILPLSETGSDVNGALVVKEKTRRPIGVHQDLEFILSAGRLREKCVIYL